MGGSGDPLHLLGSRGSFLSHKMRIRQWLLRPEHVMVRRGMCHLRRGEGKRE